MTRDEINSSQSEPMAATPDTPVVDHGRTRRWRQTAGAAAIVAVLVVGNAGTANASSRSSGRTGTPAPSTTGSTGSTEQPSANGSALHGEFTVLNRDGSAQLRRWQSGEVGAMDKISLTVRSADGYDGRYLLGPGVSVTGIEVGDEVTVVGAGQAVPAQT